MVQKANVALTEEGKAMLNEGIGLIFSQWTAMRNAVQDGRGGRDSVAKSERTITNVFEYITLSKDPVDFCWVYDILDEGLSDLNTVAADGSLIEVTEKLLDLYENCCVGNYQTVEELRRIAAKTQTTASVTKVSDDKDEESSDDEEDTVEIGRHAC